MVENIAALAAITVVSTLLPFGLLMGMVIKNAEQRVHLVSMAALGVAVYAAMEWGIKEHGLAWLFNHTNFGTFMANHYIEYLLLVAIAGAVLAVVPVTLFLGTILKDKVSFSGAIALGIGYTMAESVLLVGYRSIKTIIMLVGESDGSLSASAGELFMSAYERILLSVIQIAIFVLLVHFVQQKMMLRGSLIAVFCQSFTAFVPGFLIAFSLKDYYEVYDRKVGLGLTYIILTMAAVTSAVILYSLRHELKKR
ncbi:MAG: hypothetical protein K2K56_07845 [Lachnospiraceae bacterium]|nr:hypothetical protein [Lachnospiraceae bacterium]